MFCNGNVTEHAEANIYHDPQAADAVFAARAPTVLVGLDVTLQTLFAARDFDALADQAPNTGGFLREISRFYLNFYREVAGLEGCGLHDSTAVIACSHEHLFETQATGLRVIQQGRQARGNPARCRPSAGACVSWYRRGASHVPVHRQGRVLALTGCIGVADKASAARFTDPEATR